MRASFIGLVTAAGITAIAASTAQAAPAQSLNKTLTVSMNVTAQGMDGPRNAGTRSVTRTIYISSAGRIFARADRREGRDTERKELGPERSGGAFRFSGNNLVGVMKLASGAAQLVIAIDPSGQSCTASVQGGREGGQAYRWTAVNGEKRSGTLSFSGASCSIREGNAFGG